MTKAVYTLLAEGIAEYNFIPNYLSATGTELGIQFKRSHRQVKRSSKPSVHKVMKNVAKFAVDALLVDEEQLFLVGVDLDEPDYELKKFEKKKKEILQLIPKEVPREKTIVFIPVQAIDYWISYLNNHATAHSLESTDRKEIKRRLYGTSSPNEFGIRKIAGKSYSVSEFKKLALLSNSFKKFHDEVNHFSKQFK